MIFKVDICLHFITCPCIPHIKKTVSLILQIYTNISGLPWWLSGNESTCKAEDVGSVTESRKSFCIAYILKLLIYYFTVMIDTYWFSCQKKKKKERKKKPNTQDKLVQTQERYERS